MEDLQSQFAEEAELNLPSSDQLNSIEELANQQKDLESQMEDLESQLKDLKEQHEEITSIKLPDALGGITGFTLADGTKLKVHNVYRGHIKKENQAEAFNWLNDHDFGDLIKNQIIMRFGKGEEEHANAFMDKLEKQGELFENKKEVHSQTLKAWIREQIEAGNDIPHDLFGVYEGKKTKIEKG